MDAAGQAALGRVTMLASAAAFVGWSLLTFRSGTIAALDAATLAPTIAPSPGVSVAIGLSWLLHPLVVIAALGFAALAARRRRLFRLAGALAISGVLAWGMALATKVLFDRERPPRLIDDALTYLGSSYPSSHVTVATVAAFMLIAVARTTRRSARTITKAALAGGALMLVVALVRWFLNAHWLTDLVGGALLGMFAATLATAIFRVKLALVIEPEAPATPLPSPEKTLCAIVYNPTKIVDETGLRRRIERELAARDWPAPLWLPTTPDDPGIAMTHEAIEAGATLVLGMGGDGTIRVVCSQLAGTGITFGLVPAGTGNLLARNLSIPFDEQDATIVALDGAPREIDLVRMVVDNDESSADYFAVMGGIGFDAQLMNNTNEKLKKVVGSGAYGLAFASAMGTPPYEMRVETDDGRRFTRDAVLTVIGNVSSLQGGVNLLPDANPADGKLDVLIASPSGLGGWIRLLTSIVAKLSRRKVMQEFQARRVTITLEAPEPYEFDGDTMGEGTVFTAEVAPRVLRVMGPQPTDGLARALDREY